MDKLKQAWGWFCLYVTTFGFVGMFFWIFNKRGKGGGTVGSVATTIILIFLFKYDFSWIQIFISAIAVLFIGWLAIGPGEQFMLKKWGPLTRHNGDVVVSDFNETCIDEVHGMLISVTPIYFYQWEFWSFCMLHVFALVIFRYFDVTKLGPIKWVEEAGDKVTVAGAIMLDDTVAGIATMIIIGAAIWLV